MPTSASSNLYSHREEIRDPTKEQSKNTAQLHKEMYKARQLIENYYCKLKQYRAIATRYTKRKTK